MTFGDSLSNLSATADASATGEFYDKWAKTYDNELKEWGYTAPTRISALCKEHGVAKDARILDIGCGTGMSGEALKALGFSDIVGGDLSPESIAIIREQKSDVYSSAEVVNMEETPYPYKPDSFDAVTCVGTLSYFKGASTFEKIFGEFLRVLRPGGVALCTMREDLLLAPDVGMMDAKENLEMGGLWHCVYESKPESYLPKCPTEAGAFRIRSFVMKKTSDQPECDETLSVHPFLLKFTPQQGNVPKPWGRSADGPTFTAAAEYPVEFRQSQIPDAGRGMWAKTDIPKGVMLRRVAVADGTLIRIGSEAELLATGWDSDEAVNYGIGHHKDTSAIFFLNPGTAMNHADKTREAAVKYHHDVEGVLTLWTQRPIKAGEEMFNNYAVDFGACPWYDDLQKARGNTPLSQLDALINQSYGYFDGKDDPDAHPSVRINDDRKCAQKDVPDDKVSKMPPIAQQPSLAEIKMPLFLLKFTPKQGQVPRPWGRQAEGPTFCSPYPLEFRQSQIPDAGRGMYAITDIPKGVMLRRITVADGTLIRVGSEAELRATGWDIDDAVNYGIGHHKDASAIFFLNPGTAMNHADKSREAAVQYNHDVEGVLSLWTVRSITAGEEMFNDYGVDFGPCAWYDELQKSSGNTPLSQLPDLISKLYGC